MHLKEYFHVIEPQLDQFLTENRMKTPSREQLLTQQSFQAMIH